MSNTVIALKKSATPSAAPVDLANGELAINYADGKLFYKHANGTIAAIEGGGTGGDSFGTINANGTLIVADTPGDILTIEAGSGITITGDAINDKITISATGGDISPAFTQANTARDQANLAFAHANAAFLEANTAEAIAIASFEQANTARVHANAAFASSNSVNTYSNSTYVKLSATSQTITGNVNIVGDLTLSGNTFTIDATRLEVDDPLIYLAGNNYVSDIVDIGFIANYVNATGQNVHTGLYREHEDKMYYLFQGYDREPINNHIGALSNNMTLAVLNADLRTSNLVLGGANAILTIGAAFDKANSTTYTSNVVISVADNTNAALRITQTGTGDAIRVEDSTNPDATCFIVDANGSVGIGTQTPATQLQQYSATAVSRSIGTATIFNLEVVGGGVVSYGPTTNHPLNLVANNATVMRLDTNGRVGIGTTTPNTKLMVYGTTGSPADFRITGQNVNSFMSSFAFGDTDVVPVMELLKINGTDTARSNVRVGASLGRISWFGARGNTGDALTYRTGEIEVVTTSEASGGATPGGAMLFKTAAANSGLGPVEVVRIDANGNVGIGTTNPALKLDVSGSSTQGIRVSSTDTSGSNIAYFTAQHGSGTSLQLRAGTSYTYLLSTGAVPLYMGANSGLHMTIAASGYVGIGTTSPGARLDVAETGSVNALSRVRNAAGILDLYTLSTGDCYISAASAGKYLALGAGGSERMRIDASGNVGIGTTSTNYKLEVAGSFAAQTKSFVINHPTKSGMMLRHGSLEGPENGVYVRGKLEGKSIIELPNYWWNLIDESTITVNLTPIGRSQDIWVQSTSAYFIHLNQPADCFFTVFAERKDVDKLVVEY